MKIKASVVELVRVDELWGNGQDDDPVREVVLLFTKSGSLVAVHDPLHPHEMILAERRPDGCNVNWPEQKLYASDY